MSTDTDESAVVAAILARHFDHTLPNSLDKKALAGVATDVSILLRSTFDMCGCARDVGRLSKRTLFVDHHAESCPNRNKTVSGTFTRHLIPLSFQNNAKKLHQSKLGSDIDSECFPRFLLSKTGTAVQFNQTGSGT